ncbi:TetR/AcrR family transcriptional regulator [Acinetobacter kyonggiensis]|uniref:TetR/AcrR family transcriptional regulator, transcriptional repressor for nem operon n=1 Tax=Acinetobacter kyonggiensis TaxID=595670 RepID=A0A1H3L1X4_9GAMM|nr:TetR/AcrR family transcriptional regulator [Acinetobacter kyonggiensis]SDY58517.1 TetR/AcrR family transcriptional regulator, transcriptional repressor for nem operon [Acinetobacter kyonggiensis]
MPRASKQLAIENKKNIEAITSQLIRDQGFAISVADLMNAAGLTHGGFYKHFQNKDELIDIACQHIFAESLAKWEKIIAESNNNDMALNKIIQSYLAEKNIENPAESCPLSSLTIDVAREQQDKPVKKSFEEGIHSLLSILSQLGGQGEEQEITQQAIVQLSLLSGSLILARAVNHEFALTILHSVKSFMLKQENELNG